MSYDESNPNGGKTGAVSKSNSFRKDAVENKILDHQIEPCIKTIGENWKDMNFFKKWEALGTLLNLLPLHIKKISQIEKSFEEIKLTDLLMEVFRHRVKKGQDKAQTANETKLREIAIKMCLVYSDVSATFAQALTKSGAVEFFTQLLEGKISNWGFAEKEKNEIQRDSVILLLYLVNKGTTDISAFKKADSSAILHELARNGDGVTRVAALIILAYIHGGECDPAKDAVDVIQLLTKWITEAFKNKQEKRSLNGFQAVVLINALSKFAVFDSNKKWFMESETLKMIKAGMEKNYDPFIDAACRNLEAALFMTEDQAFVNSQQYSPDLSDTQNAESWPTKGYNAVKSLWNKALQQKDYDIDLLLVGKTGNGKSATGNTILGKEYFASDASVESVTKNVDYNVVRHKGRIIKVFDGPGVGDTCSINDVEKATKLVIDKMKDAVSLNPRGYHAFLLVVRFGGRFTAEDKEVIRMLKAIFGSDFVRNFCILVVTCGDNFKMLVKKKHNKSFKKWCEEQGGIFQELLQECQNRAILFDNTSKDRDVRNKQMEKLIKEVDNLQYGGRRYNDANFKRVEADREVLLVQVKEPMIREKTLTKMSLILQDLENASLVENTEEKLDLLENLLKDTDELLTSVVETDKETGVLHQTIASVNGVRKTIVEKISYENMLYNLKLQNQKREEEITNKYQKDTDSLQKDLHLIYEEHKLEEAKRQETERKEEMKRAQLEAKRTEEFKQREIMQRNKFEEERKLFEKTTQDQQKQLNDLLKNKMLDSKHREELENQKSKLAKQIAEKIRILDEKEKKFESDMKRERDELKSQIEFEQNEHQKQLNALRIANNTIIAGLKSEIEAMNYSYLAEIKKLKNELQQQLESERIKGNQLSKQHQTELNAAKINYDNLKKKHDDLVKKSEELSCVIS